MLANDLLLAALQPSGVVSVVASEELPAPVVWPRAGGAPGLAVCLDPLDGSLNSDVAGVMGTIFGIWPGPAAGETDPARAVLARRNPAGRGRLPRLRRRHRLRLCGGMPAPTRSSMTRPTGSSGSRRPACAPRPPGGPTRSTTRTGRTGARPRAPSSRSSARAAAGEGRYALRYSGALAADFHRTLLEGGIYLYPEDRLRPGGRIRLLYEAAPLAFVAEAAGGRASTGRGRLLDVVATDYHQRTPLYIGSPEEVAWAERCYREHPG